MAVQQQVLVVEDFEAHYEDELSLSVGDYVTVTQHNVEAGWWEGTDHSGQSGRFPAMFVQVINRESQEDANMCQNVSMKKVHVVVEFEGGEEGELKLVAGELLTVAKHDEEEGWLQGYTQAGHYGRFPSFFVEDIPENQQMINQNMEVAPVSLPSVAEIPENQQRINQNMEVAPVSLPSVAVVEADNMNAQVNFDTSQNNLGAAQMTNILETFQEFVNQHATAEVWKADLPNIQDEPVDDQVNQPFIGATGGGGSQEDTSQITNTNQRKVVVLEDFISAEGGELSIYKGETLTVTRTNIEWEDTWWEGVNLMGEMGRFPRIFVNEAEEKPLIEQQDCEPCGNMHHCGHKCSGVKGEQECLPCLFGCANKDKLNQSSEDMCVICFTETLIDKPSIQLECGHMFHAGCCRDMLLQSYPGPRITFTYMCCPICKAQMNHWCLSDLLQPSLMILKHVEEQALQRLDYDQLKAQNTLQDDKLSQDFPPDSTSNTVQNEESSQDIPPNLTTNSAQNSGAIVKKSSSKLDKINFAMNHYAFCMCYKCKKPYFGGDVSCEEEANQSETFDPRELVCGTCSDVSKNKMCPKHGTEFLIFKCQFCCSVAVYFCRGTHHVCNACHEDFHHVEELQQANRLPKCPAGPRGAQLCDVSCPLQMTHPETGAEYCIGCALCSNTFTFNKKKTESLPPPEPPMPYY